MTLLSLLGARQYNPDLFPRLWMRYGLVAGAFRAQESQVSFKLQEKNPLNMLVESYWS